MSIFRYPGAKPKLLPVIMPFLDRILEGEREFCDAFVGGGSVALAVADKYKKKYIVLNDKDDLMYSFWKVICEYPGLLYQLYELIDQPVDMNLYELNKNTPPPDLIYKAYYAIFFNRTNFSGILSSGPIGGKNQLSKYKVNCRYNSAKIKKAINNASQLLMGRTEVFNYDICSLLTHDRFITPEVPMYLDPPYRGKGKMLYPTYMEDSEHKEMARLLQQRGKWVLSYDDDSMIKDIYSFANIQNIDAQYSINGVKTSWAKKNELLISPLEKDSAPIDSN